MARPVAPDDAPVDVVVLGAGPAGLAAARRAAGDGRSVVLVEAGDRVGGMAASLEVGGIRVDLGSHRLHPATAPEVLADLRSLLGDELQQRPRRGRIRVGGRWVAFPLRAGDLVRSLPPGLAVRFAADAATGPLRRPRAATYAEEVRAGLGPTALAEVYGPFARTLWGTGPDELSGVLARRRISATGAGDVVRRLARAAGPGGLTFWYPRRGFGRIAEALADDAVARGVDLRLGARVAAIEPPAPDGVGAACAADGGWGRDRVVVHLADGGRVRAGTVLSTLPAAVLPGLVPAGSWWRPPPAVVRAAGAVRHRAMALVYLVVDRRPYTGYDAHYVPDESAILSRLSEPTQYRVDLADPRDRTVLCAEVPCWPTDGDRWWSASDAELADRVAADLVALGLPPVEPVGVHVERLPRVYPVIRAGDGPGGQEDVATLAGWARSLEPHVVTFGRQGLVVGDNTHQVLAMGEAAAACLGPDGAWDGAGWQAALERFAAHVVED